MGNLREYEVHSASLLGLGFTPGEVHYAALQSGVSYGFLRDNRRVPSSRLHTTMPDAYKAVGTKNGSNGVVVLSPDNNPLSATQTFNKNMTHVVGDFPAGMFANRARLGMSTTFTPMITVSGYGNLFKNLYTMHGTATGDLTSWLISGDRNKFENVHMAGPMVAGQGTNASYIGVDITGSENYFKNCVFGSQSITRTQTAPNMRLAGTDNVFEDCIFLMAIAGNTTPYFINFNNVTTMNAYFKRCLFYVFSANHAAKAAVAFTFAAGASADIVLDAGCSFCGVSELAVTGSLKYIWAPTVFAATADELNLIAINSATF